MLNVTENGVKITLDNQPVASPFLVLIMGVGLLICATIVGLALGYLSEKASIGAIAVIAVGSYAWRVYQNKHEATHITGGQIVLSKYLLEHHQAVSKKSYTLQNDDNIEINNDVLTVKNVQGKVRLTVSGFSQPQYLNISKAVLEGKQIQTNAKAIKLQSN